MTNRNKLFGCVELVPPVLIRSAIYGVSLGLVWSVVTYAMGISTADDAKAIGLVVAMSTTLGTWWGWIVWRTWVEEVVVRVHESHGIRTQDLLEKIHHLASLRGLDLHTLEEEDQAVARRFGHHVRNACVQILSYGSASIMYFGIIILATSGVRAVFELNVPLYEYPFYLNLLMAGGGMVVLGMIMYAVMWLWAEWRLRSWEGQVRMLNEHTVPAPKAVVPDYDFSFMWGAYGRVLRLLWVVFTWNRGTSASADVAGYRQSVT